MTARELVGTIIGRIRRGPVARAGVAVVAVVAGVVAASLTRAIGAEVLAPGVAGGFLDVAWVGIAVAVACQLGLAVVAVVVPERWPVTRRG